MLAIHIHAQRPMNDEPERPSKSERKRMSSELQALGERLIELSESELDDLPLPEQLRDAVLLAKRITKHGGLYRQKQYIGKLMRKIDVEPIREALDARRARERAEALRFRRVEQWRDRLLAGEPGARDRLLEELPQLDVARIERLVAEARREREAQAPPRAARELFRLLREAFD